MGDGLVCQSGQSLGGLLGKACHAAWCGMKMCVAAMVLCGVIFTQLGSGDCGYCIESSAFNSTYFSRVLTRWRAIVRPSAPRK